MKKLADRLKRIDITLAKGYMKWYRVIDNELRLFINEQGTDDSGQLHNKLYWKENRAELCIDSLEYATKFYYNYKDYKVRFFIRPESGNLYSEYSVNSWGLNENGIEIIFE